MKAGSHFIIHNQKWKGSRGHSTYKLGSRQTLLGSQLFLNFSRQWQAVCVLLSTLNIDQGKTEEWPMQWAKQPFLRWAFCEAEAKERLMVRSETFLCGHTHLNFSHNETHNFLEKMMSKQINGNHLLHCFVWVRDKVSTGGPGWPSTHNPASASQVLH